MKPLLAVDLTDPTKLKFPVYVSPKYDGIRALVVDGQMVTRKLLPIPNTYIREMLSDPALSGLDGELVSGDNFQDATGSIMSEDGEPTFTYYVFDDFTKPSERLADRLHTLRNRLRGTNLPIVIAPQILCANNADIDVEHALNLARDFEGSMVRRIDGHYKDGRSTENEGLCLKLKSFKRLEGKIVGFTEKMHNENEATKDALGRTKRGHSKKGKVPAGTLGAFVLETPEFKGTHKVGTGMDAKLRKHVWDSRPDYLGKFVTFQFQEHGTKDKPRIASFIGIRDPRDMGDPD